MQERLAVRVLAALICLMPVTVLAQDDLRQATEHFKLMQYDQALELTQRVIRSVDSGPEELASAYRVEGFCMAAMDRIEEAVEAFRKLLAIDPTFRLEEDTTPKISIPFDQALEAADKQAPIRLTHEPPELGEKLGGTELKATLTSNPLEMVQAVLLRYRIAGAKKEVVELFHVESSLNFSTELPTGLEAQQISYYFKAVNRYGATIAFSGSKAKPYRLRIIVKPEAKVAPVAPPVRRKEMPPRLAAPVVVPQPPPVVAAVPPPARRESVDQDKHWYQTWWFWTALGVAVVAGTTAGVVLGMDSEGSVGPDHFYVRLE